MSYPYRLSNDSIDVVTDTGKPLKMLSTDPDFENVKQAIRDGEWDDVFCLMDRAKRIEMKSDNRMRVRDGRVFVDNLDGEEFEVPTDLGETILMYISEDLPVTPLVSFAQKLGQNPSRRSVEQLFRFITTNGVTINENGNMVLYKGVRKNYTDCYSGTIKNEIGVPVKMLRNTIDENPEVTCSQGLHVASYDYAHNLYGFGNVGVTLVVEVNPRDVVSCPVDHNDAKLRVCEYVPVAVCKENLEDKRYVDCDEEFGDDDSCGCCCEDAQSDDCCCC